jgi:predicted DsbA family dithiol-disulfide isomerase
MTRRCTNDSGPVVEVFADVGCPFTHVGLRRFVERRAAAGRDDIRLWVRSWPLEVVNGAPLDLAFVAEEISEIRAAVAPDLFAGFDPARFPRSTLPALAVAAAAYRRDLVTGERVSLRLRNLLFEEGVDVSRSDVLARVVREFALEVDLSTHTEVLAEHAAGARRGVVGSPHFFTPAGGFFCPALDVRRDAEGHLRVTADPERFESFVEACLA